MASKISQDERIAKMIFGSVYPHYVTKVEKKGHAEADLLKVLEGLTGFTKAQINKHIENKSTIERLFDAATLHPNASLIKGVIYGYRVEDIENHLTQKARDMDKLVDELARGKKMESILRTWGGGARGAGPQRVVDPRGGRARQPLGRRAQESVRE